VKVGHGSCSLEESVESLSNRVQREAKAAGLAIQVVSAPTPAREFGDAVVLATLHPITLRFVRERSQDWLEIAPGGALSGPFYFFDDVEIAQGWRTVDDVLNMRDVEPLGVVLARVALRWRELADSLGGPAESPGWRGVAEAKIVRGKAFAARLR
jgi:hypothetical protein